MDKKEKRRKMMNRRIIEKEEDENKLREYKSAGKGSKLIKKIVVENERKEKTETNDQIKEKGRRQ